MIQVVCELIVIACISAGAGKCINIQSKDTLSGNIKGSGDYKYLVDFSKDAKKKEYVGDYSNTLVNKSDCVELK